MLEYYSIDLANGEQWLLMPVGEASPWVAKLAILLGLKRIEDGSPPRQKTVCQNITRLDGPVDPSFFGIRILREDGGWTVHDFGTVRNKFHDAMPHVVTELDTTGPDVSDINTTLSILYPLYEYLYRRGGFTFHAALLEWQGMGCLLTGPSGSGKSTACRRLPDPWQVLCDEEVMVIPGPDGTYCAHPAPTWSRVALGQDKSDRSINDFRPLNAVFILERHYTDLIEKIGPGEILISLLRSAISKWDRFVRPDIDQKRRSSLTILQNVLDFCNRVSVYRLRVSLQGAFWKEMEGVMASGRPNAIRSLPV